MRRYHKVFANTDTVVYISVEHTEKLTPMLNCENPDRWSIRASLGRKGRNGRWRLHLFGEVAFVFEAIQQFKEGYCDGWNADMVKAIAAMENDVHLNDLNAGTIEQKKAIRTYLEKSGKEFDYADVCAYLKSIGLYEVEVNGKPYKYGHGWLWHPVSKENADFLYNLPNPIDKTKIPAWAI